MAGSTWTEERKAKFRETLRRKKRAKHAKHLVSDAATTAAIQAVSQATPNGHGTLNVTILSQGEGLEIDKFAVRTWGQLFDALTGQFAGRRIYEVRVEEA